MYATQLTDAIGTPASIVAVRITGINSSNSQLLN
ncbi:unnamed protein product, partial [Rotaria magnacalcarata]